jgi:hypothetical protein
MPRVKRLKVQTSDACICLCFEASILSNMTEPYVATATAYGRMGNGVERSVISSRTVPARGYRGRRRHTSWTGAAARVHHCTVALPLARRRKKVTRGITFTLPFVQPCRESCS